VLRRAPTRFAAPPRAHSEFAQTPGRVLRIRVVVARLRRGGERLLFEVVQQQRERTVEDGGRIAVGHVVAHQLLHASEGVVARQRKLRAAPLRRQRSLHVLRGAPEPHDAHVHAPLHAPDECVHQEGREPRGSRVLYFMYYDFARVHQTLRGTPAMEAGVANHV
jgi:hypothetical protein